MYLPSEIPAFLVKFSRLHQVVSSDVSRRKKTNGQLQTEKTNGWIQTRQGLPASSAHEALSFHQCHTRLFKSVLLEKQLKSPQHPDFFSLHFLLLTFVCSLKPPPPHPLSLLPLGCARATFIIINHYHRLLSRALSAEIKMSSFVCLC